MLSAFAAKFKPEAFTLELPHPRTTLVWPSSPPTSDKTWVSLITSSPSSAHWNHCRRQWFQCAELGEEVIKDTHVLSEVGGELGQTRVVRGWGNSSVNASGLKLGGKGGEHVSPSGNIVAGHVEHLTKFVLDTLDLHDKVGCLAENPRCSSGPLFQVSKGLVCAGSLRVRCGGRGRRSVSHELSLVLGKTLGFSELGGDMLILPPGAAEDVDARVAVQVALFAFIDQCVELFEPLSVWSIVLSVLRVGVLVPLQLVLADRWASGGNPGLPVFVIGGAFTFRGGDLHVVGGHDQPDVGRRVEVVP